MAFCSNGLKAVRDIWNKITPVIEKAVEDITLITGAIKLIEQNITVEALIAIIPGGSAYEAILNKAMDEIVIVADVTKTLAEKLNAWLNGKTTLEIHDNLFKLASVGVKHADVLAGNAPQSESFYDSAVQLHVIVNK